MRANQRGPAITAKLARIHVAVAHAALLFDGGNPNRNWGIKPSLQGTHNRVADAGAGDIRNDDLAGRRLFAPIADQGGDFVQQCPVELHAARTDWVNRLPRLAWQIPAPLQKRVATVDE